MIFELCELVSTPAGVIKQTLPAATIADASLRIARRKRHTDIVAHYETHNFAVLLPGTGSGGTKVFANKMIKSMGESPLQGAAGKKASVWLWVQPVFLRTLPTSTVSLALPK
ncbi:MAG: hypothetical protein IPP97_08735 [Candidatus Obscuribacter sp.]|nr:hypothetical protein [Candidatus Obscuribacter sp.]